MERGRSRPGRTSPMPPKSGRSTELALDLGALSCMPVAAERAVFFGLAAAAAAAACSSAARRASRSPSRRAAWSRARLFFRRSCGRRLLSVSASAFSISPMNSSIENSEPFLSSRRTGWPGRTADADFFSAGMAGSGTGISTAGTLCRCCVKNCHQGDEVRSIARWERKGNGGCDLTAPVLHRDHRCRDRSLVCGGDP